jgi:hypothetical protein
VLKGAITDEVVRSRFAPSRSLLTCTRSRPIHTPLPQALQVVAHAKEVSHPDT